MSYVFSFSTSRKCFRATKHEIWIPKTTGNDKRALPCVLIATHSNLQEMERRRRSRGREENGKSCCATFLVTVMTSLLLRCVALQFVANILRNALSITLTSQVGERERDMSKAHIPLRVE